MKISYKNEYEKGLIDVLSSGNGLESLIEWTNRTTNNIRNSSLEGDINRYIFDICEITTRVIDTFRIKRTSIDFLLDKFFLENINKFNEQIKIYKEILEYRDNLSGCALSLGSSIALDYQSNKKDDEIKEYIENIQFASKYAFDDMGLPVTKFLDFLSEIQHYSLK